MVKKRKAERDHEFNMKLIELAKGAGAEGFNVLKEGMKAWGEFAKSENDMVQAAAIAIPVSLTTTILMYLGLLSAGAKPAGFLSTTAGIGAGTALTGMGFLSEQSEILEKMKPFQLFG